MQPLILGETEITRVVEFEGPSFYVNQLVPKATDAEIEPFLSWLKPHFIDEVSGRGTMSLHAYVIRTPKHTILVDTCVGNHKNRPGNKAWHMKDGPFLQDLMDHGVHPDEVDFVMCTHLHVDHVGWNTQLIDGRWVPTFPNAKYIFHKTEYDFWTEEVARGAESAPDIECYTDSVLPVVEAGQAVMVGGDHQIDDNMHFVPSPGHTPGHVCIDITGGGQHALMTGDLMHHPVQVARPDWNSMFCVDPVMSAATRQKFVEDNADTGTHILAAHFAKPTVGTIVSEQQGFKFQV